MENRSILTDKQLDKLKPDTLFDFIDKSPLDTLHRKLLKYTLGINKSAPNMAIYGDKGETPLAIKGFTLMVNFWYHLTNLPGTSLANIALKENIEMRSNWIKTIEKILNIFNLAEHIDSTIFNFLSKKIRKNCTNQNGKKQTTIDYSRL